MQRQYSAPAIKKFITDVFICKGMLQEEADICAEGLITADLRGIDSHGVARLSGYIRLIDANRLNPCAQMKFIHETPTTATLDADGGAGLIAGQLAMKKAIEKAEKYGSGWVAVTNSNHFGIAAHHAMLAASHHMIGMAMTNASPLVAPPDAQTRMLGTNPLCVVVPSRKHAHFVLDMATSTAANGKLEIATRKHESIPKGWLVDKEGNETSDPSALKAGGALLPLGSDKEHGIHKGFGLSALVDILSSIGGSGFGPFVPPFVSFLPVIENSPGTGIGHFFGAIRVDGFRPLDDYYKHIDTWLDTFMTTPAKNEKARVIIPGEPEDEAYKQRFIKGIPIHPEVVADLKSLAETCGFSFPETVE